MFEIFDFRNMKKKIAINGFGRIGRMSFRALLKKKNCAIVAINDLATPDLLAHLLQYDTHHGQFQGTIQVTEKALIINGQTIAVSAEKNPQNLPWQSLAINTVLESTGLFIQDTQAYMHIQAGAQKVIISAPAKGNVPTIVLGVNDHILKGDEKIISNASCTTNCLAPMVKVIEENFGIEKGYMNTIHAYTADQNIQDAPHKDFRRARAAFQSIIPTATGAAQAIGLVIPSLEGKLQGMAMRVPVGNGSIVDCTLHIKQPATTDNINATMLQASKYTLKNILAYTTAPIVSADIIGNTHSCIFDASLTACYNNLIRIIGWYDNESAYAQRIADLIAKI